MLQLNFRRLVDWDDPTIKTLLALSVGNPTPEKLERTRAWYAAGPEREPEREIDILCLGEQPIGLLGTERLPGLRLEIRHLAVARDHQRQGYGRRLIEELSRRHPGHTMLATTDQDAVEFYRRSGFRIRSLGENSYGRERFDCRRDWPWVSGSTLFTRVTRVLPGSS